MSPRSHSGGPRSPTGGARYQWCPCAPRKPLDCRVGIWPSPAVRRLSRAGTPAMVSSRTNRNRQLGAMAFPMGAYTSPRAAGTQQPASVVHAGPTDGSSVVTRGAAHAYRRSRSSSGCPVLPGSSGASEPAGVLAGPGSGSGCHVDSRSVPVGRPASGSGSGGAARRC